MFWKPPGGWGQILPKKNQTNGPGTRPAHSRPRSGHCIGWGTHSQLFDASIPGFPAQGESTLPAVGSTRQLTVENNRFWLCQQPTSVDETGKVRCRGRDPRTGPSQRKGPRLSGRAAKQGLLYPQGLSDREPLPLVLLRFRGVQLSLGLYAQRQQDSSGPGCGPSISFQAGIMVASVWCRRSQHGCQLGWSTWGRGCTEWTEQRWAAWGEEMFPGERQA